VQPSHVAESAYEFIDAEELLARLCEIYRGNSTLPLPSIRHAVLAQRAGYYLVTKAYSYRMGCQCSTLYIEEERCAISLSVLRLARTNEFDLWLGFGHRSDICYKVIDPLEVLIRRRS
jgi:hypothetical protein